MRLVASPRGFETAKIYLTYFRLRGQPVKLITEPDLEKAKEKFIKLFREGKIKKRLGPVGVCPHCGSDEIEYATVRRETYYVLFRGDNNFLTWITNLKYLPGVTALAVDPERTYCLFRHGEEEFIAMEGFKFGEPVECFRGKEIGGTAENPVNGIRCKIIHTRVGSWGTGIVPLAPAHSRRDYEVSKKFNVAVINAIGRDGIYTRAAGPLSGENAFLEERVEDLIKKDILFKEEAEVKIPVCRGCHSEALVVFGETWLGYMEPVTRSYIPRNFKPEKGWRNITGATKYPMPLYVCPVCGYEGPESKICPRCGERMRWKGLHLHGAFVWGATMEGHGVFGDRRELSWASALSEFDYGILATKLPPLDLKRFSNIVRLVENVARREGVCFEVGLTSHAEPEDRWLLSLLQRTLQKYISLMDVFEHRRAAHLLNTFIRAISKKYIPVVRSRMWLPPGDPLRDAVYQTLYGVLKLLFPMLLPFSEAVDLLYKRTIKRCVGKPSVHHMAIPNPRKYLIDRKLEEEMDRLFQARRAFLRLRQRLGIPLRYPLLHASVRGTSLIRTFLRSVNALGLGEGGECEKFPGGEVCTDGAVDKEGALVAEIRRRIQALKKEVGISPFDKVIVEVWSDASVISALRRHKRELERRINGKLLFSNVMSGHKREYTLMGHYVRVVIGRA